MKRRAFFKSLVASVGLLVCNYGSFASRLKVNTMPDMDKFFLAEDEPPVVAIMPKDGKWVTRL